MQELQQIILNQNPENCSGEYMKLSKITGLILTLGTFVVWFAAIFGLVKGDTALIFGVGLLALWKGEELLELRDR